MRFRRLLEFAQLHPGASAAVLALPLAVLAGIAVLAFGPRGFDHQASQDYGPVTVAPVTRSVQDQQRCRALIAALPDNLLGHGRPVTAKTDRERQDPAAEYAAAWSDPAIVLRCGVGRPASLTPSAQLIGVQGVDWVAATTNSGTTWTTVSLPMYVELTVPKKYRSDTATQLLNPLAAPLLAASSPKPAP
ncbi:MAG TPA: DUF3515 domain-containing protein [Mycobacteriales bacterium]|jgi:hypothetical protein|nr:DUF3515 domain-containing protein [Mycobacteriales bacterium]